MVADYLPLIWRKVIKMNELFKIRVVKNEKVYYDIYLVWLYKEKVYYERIVPSFWGVSSRILIGHAREAENVQKMLCAYKEQYCS